MRIAYTYNPRSDSRLISVEIPTYELIRTGTPDELMKILPPEHSPAHGNKVSEILYRLSVLAKAIEDANTKQHKE